MAFFKRKKTEDKEEKKAVETIAKIKDGQEKEGQIKDSKERKVSQTKPKDNQVSKGKSMKELYGESGQVARVATKDGKKVKKQRKYGHAYKTLIKPMVTEKAANLGAFNKYVFEVAPKVNKIEIAKAINEVYGIKPIDVNIIKMRGKKVNYGRYQGKRRDWKKAIVTLPAGKTINIYEGV